MKPMTYKTIGSYDALRKAGGNVQKRPALASSEKLEDYKHYGIRTDAFGRIAIINPDGRVIGLASSVESAKQDIDALVD